MQNNKKISSIKCNLFHIFHMIIQGGLPWPWEDKGIKNKNKDSYKLMHTPLGNKKFSLPALDKLNPSQQAIHDEAWSTCPFRDKELLTKAEEWTMQLDNVYWPSLISSSSLIS